MVHKVKSYTYQHQGNDILVKDHFGIISGKEEVFLNGDLIAFHESRISKFEKPSFILIDQKVHGKMGEEFHLKVVSGMHLNIFPRTHIYVNGLLVAGDVENPLYVPPSPWFCLMIFLSFVGIINILVDDIPLIYRYTNQQMSIRSKINSNSSELWQKEISHYFKKESELKSKKKNEWTENCNTNSDHYCRLLSYIYGAEGDNENRIAFALKACDKEVLSCYQAYLSPSFSIKHTSYLYVIKNIKTLCLKTEPYSEREKIVCSEFSRSYLRESGDEQTFMSISKKLCDEGYKYGCTVLKASVRD